MPWTNYLDSERLIIERLKAKLGNVCIKTAGNLDEVEAENFTAPAVYVIYDGDEIAGGFEGRSLEAFQRWTIIVVIHQSCFSAEAGPWMFKIMQALHGHELSCYYQALTRSSSNPPIYGGRYAYIPLNFRTRMFINFDQLGIDENG